MIAVLLSAVSPVTRIDFITFVLMLHCQFRRFEIQPFLVFPTARWPVVWPASRRLSDPQVRSLALVLSDSFGTWTLSNLAGLIAQEAAMPHWLSVMTISLLIF
jgi:hypothetical protein